ncbi:DUF3786 domain-containing protein [Intestinibacter sp.]|uniref:DUF3786 domain-containing protein n=1 Tax=Intestinibacter sp. TaxID=1965304 RepID=UPI002A90B3E9|nr:DUF3786 domain-containing protein [Intestinibacter sp.]MDY5210919.1 DUF3786 domain-containing protein [Intestinibacter sp.]
MSNKKENRAFNEMYIAAKKRLEGREPLEIAQNSGAEFDEKTSTIKIKSLDRIVEISYPTYDISENRDDWQVLTLLHYLDLADKTPVSYKLIHFGELKDGLIRGARFDKTAEFELERFLKNKQPQEVIEVFKSLDGKIIDSKADLSAVFYIYPYYPVTLNIWFEDEEFPATGKIFLDKTADHYLTIEDAVGVGEIMLKAINDRYIKLYGNRV